MPYHQVEQLLEPKHFYLPILLLLNLLHSDPIEMDRKKLVSQTNNTSANPKTLTYIPANHQ